MKLQRTDPPRLAEDEASELGRLMRLAGRRTMGPAATSRIARDLEARGAFATGAARAAAHSHNSLGHLGSAKLAALALIAIGGMFVVWGTERSAPVAAIEAPATAPAHTADEPSAPVIPPETPPVPVEALPAPAATDAPVASPSSRVNARTAPAAVLSAATTSTAATHAAVPSQSEFALIRRAQVALASDPASALAIVEEHARTFPNGELVQERELSAVEALARLGRKSEASARAHALLDRFPRTPYVARLERALGEPISAEGASKAAR